MRVPDYPSSDSERWSAVDQFLGRLLAPQDRVLEEALAANAAAGLPRIDVSPAQGKMLALLVKMTKASRVLEIGALGGYSTIWMARALPAGGRLVSIELDERHAEVARGNLERGGLADRVDLRIGSALDVMPGLDGAFDLIFIDADKPGYPSYLKEALRLSRPGTVIVGDNVVRNGGIADPSNADPNVEGVRAFLRMMADEPRLDATAIQTVGEKGWDGFALAVVNG